MTDAKRDSREISLHAQVTTALTTQRQQQPQLPQHTPPQQVLSSWQDTTDAAADADEFLDPITFDIIVDPVFGSNGCTYDRFTAYKLMSEACAVPGCDGPFTFGVDNVHFRGRLRRAHPETEAAMQQRRHDCLKVRNTPLYSWHAGCSTRAMSPEQLCLCMT